MKQVGVLFGDSQPLRAGDLSDIVGVNKSSVLRAALHLGLAKLEAVASKSPEEAKNLTIIEDAKCRQ
jgi:hypothetical protein